MSLESKPRVTFEFEVEKIIGISADGNYQVQWAPAWVSKFHLAGCEHLIQEFLNEQQQQHQRQQHDQHQEEQQEPQQHQREAPLLEVGLEVSRNINMIEDETNKNLATSQVDGLLSLQPYVPPTVQPAVQPTVQSTVQPIVHVKDEETDMVYPLVSLEHVDESKEKEVWREGAETSSTNFIMQQHDITQDSYVAEKPSCFAIETCPKTTIVDCTQELTDAHEQQTTIRNDHYNVKNRPRHPFTCDYCGYSSKRKYDLARHMRSHTGDKPYICNVCDKRCTQKSNLLQHMKTHTLSD